MGPFIVNSRQVFKEFEALLKKMNFDLGGVWHYDPHGVISQKREKIKASTYEHEYRPKIEWKDNLNSWLMNTKMEIKILVKHLRLSNEHLKENTMPMDAVVKTSFCFFLNP